MENNNDKRTSRASQTREKTSQKKVWTPPSSLDAPPAPTGFKHRWLRAESLGFQDTKNIAGRLDLDTNWLDPMNILMAIIQLLKTANTRE